MLEKIKEKWEEILLHIKEEHELSYVSLHAEKVRFSDHRGHRRNYGNRVQR